MSGQEQIFFSGKLIEKLIGYKNMGKIRKQSMKTKYANEHMLRCYKCGLEVSSWIIKGHYKECRGEIKKKI